jgi:hypothetical protein
MTPSIYGCHGSTPRDPAATYPVQDGWRYYADEHGEMTRMPIIVEQVSKFNNGCQYTIRSPDPECNGCPQAAR